MMFAIKDSRPQERPSGAVGSKAGLEIVIDARHNPPSLSLRRDGMKVTWSSGWALTQRLPAELVPLLYASAYQSGYGEDPLLRYLRHGKGAYPLILETRHEAVPLRWDPSATCLCKTALDAGEDQITIRAVCLADGIELTRFVHFRSFVADLDGARLLHLEDEQGWNSWLTLHRGLAAYGRDLSDDEIVDHGVRQFLLPDPSGARQWQSRSEKMATNLSLPELHAAQIDVILHQVDKVARDLILTVGGRLQSLLRRDSVPDQERPVHRLVLIPPSPSEAIPGALYRLRAECRSGDRTMAPSASVFGFFPYLEQAPTCPPPCAPESGRSSSMRPSTSGPSRTPRNGTGASRPPCMGTTSARARWRAKPMDSAECTGDLCASRPASQPPRGAVGAAAGG